MPLSPGFRLGAYEVLAKLGEGGMDEVYRARDTRLKRDVAIKVLPETVASEPERVIRFEREAELLATLDHPNIAGIYGFEESPTVNGIVLERVEGPTLWDRIARGPLLLDETLTVANQVLVVQNWDEELSASCLPDKCSRTNLGSFSWPCAA